MNRRSILFVVLAASLSRSLHAQTIDDGIMLSGPSQFTVAVPAQVTSLEHQSELTAIKNAQARLT